MEAADREGPLNELMWLVSRDEMKSSWSCFVFLKFKTRASARAGNAWGSGVETGVDFFCQWRARNLVGGVRVAIWGQKGPKQGQKAGGHISFKKGVRTNQKDV